MELRFGNFHVKDVVFGEKTSFNDGVLTINKEEALELLKKDERIIKIDLVIVKPGESVRLLPVKAILEARCKITEGSYFPGYYGPMKPSGEGVTHILRDMSVMAVGKYGNFEDGVLDMGGEGAKHSMFSEIINVAIIMESTDEIEEYNSKEAHPNEYAHRNATFVLAEYLAETIRDLEPDDYEDFKFDPILKPSSELEKLPKVAFVLCAETNGGAVLHQAIYGWPLGNSLPFLISPTILLDGNLTCNQMHVAGMGCYDYNEINNPIIYRLCREHGKTINFIGVIVSNDNADLTCKQRTIMMTVQLCKTLGIDGAVVNLPGYGNTYIDYIQTIVDLQEAGIVVTGVGLECCGRDGKGNPFTIMRPEADKLVTAGNISEVVTFPPVEKIYGDLQCLVRDPSSGSWIDDEVYGPSIREDGTILCENNYVVGGCSSHGESKFTVKEF